VIVESLIEEVEKGRDVPKILGFETTLGHRYPFNVS
jgi:hypothetical protein